MTEQAGNHEAKADEVERSLDEMEERTGRLGDEIEGAGEDWERKQRDPGVPGAVEDSSADDSEVPAADGEDLDFGRDVDYQEVAAPAARAEDDSADEGDFADEGDASGSGEADGSDPNDEDEAS